MLLLQVTREISGRAGWGAAGGLISGFNNSMILKNEGLFHGSLQFGGYNLISKRPVEY